MPGVITVKASRGEGARSITVEREFGNNVGEMVKIFGEEAVYAAAHATMTADLRKMVTTRLKANEPDEEIIAAVAAWKPPLRTGDPLLVRINKLMEQLPGEKQAALLRRYGVPAS